MTYAGLKSMIADPHLEIFNTMLRLRRGNRKTVRKLMRDIGIPGSNLRFEHFEIARAAGVVAHQRKVGGGLVIHMARR